MEYTLPCACVLNFVGKKVPPVEQLSHGGTGAPQLLFETRSVHSLLFVTLCLLEKCFMQYEIFSDYTSFRVHLYICVFSAVKFLNLCAPSLCQCRVTVADIVVGTSSLISKRAYELHMPLNSAASVCAVYAVCYVYLILSARPCHYLI